ncbi:CPBP family intramembrane glutamic endopeptidase [Paramaledivibacter caminithermalis]|uniref:CAAX prenyl protease 2/Lysostaphin resistance protein A-like domain-containing protein n=1 Tax=Paramaledivibacter caminithermalis (strain DSM 15212 / CIP 107654 / DViRD3) TaxID=1121301 RepID=A0A1M6SCJ3_PARC5|nr:CPBP family intramembrane glutamic endopeptidase [Paramaledivibacter caminithermalis]SHK42450.1 hypothetical protein SAMN02745912_03267 [Paramaledivibacter caminithermalis DSM 15212]
MEQVNMEKKGFSIIGAFGIAALIFLLQVALLIPLHIIDIIIAEIGFNEVNIYIDVIGEILINILIILLIVKMIGKKQKFNFKFKYKPSIKECLFALLLLGSHLLIFSNTIGVFIEKIEVSEWVVEAFDEVFVNPIIAFISLCVIAPVFEEIIYRGIILEQLSKRYSFTTSIIVSGLIFAFIHANIHQGVNAFFIGLILGFIYLKTNSLLLCMLWHFANNFLVFITSIYITETVNDTDLQFSIVQLIFGIILLIISYRFFNNREAECELAVSDT